jgi:activator of HSP90 ATPase
MIIKVIRAFLDKCDDLKKREIGEEIEVDENRAKSLIERGFAEEVKESETKSEKPTAAKTRAKTKK